MLANRVRRRHMIAYTIVVLVSAVPIIFHIVKSIATNEFHSGWDVLSSGDLILVAVAVSAGSAVELMRRKDTTGLDEIELLILGATLALLFTSGWLYAFVTGGTAAAHKALIGWCSLGPLIVSLLIGTGSILSIPEGDA